MKPQRDEARAYAETVEALGNDPLSGETETDKQLRISSAQLSAGMKALKETVTTDWGKLAALPAVAPIKRKVSRNGQGAQ